MRPYPPIAPHPPLGCLLFMGGVRLSAFSSENQGMPSENVNNELLNLHSLFHLPELTHVRKQVGDFNRLLK